MSSDIAKDIARMQRELAGGHLILLTLSHPGLHAPLRVAGTDRAIMHANREFVPYSFDLNLDKRTIKIDIPDRTIAQLVEKYNMFSVFMELVDLHDTNRLINAYNFPEMHVEKR